VLQWDVRRRELYLPVIGPLLGACVIRTDSIANRFDGTDGRMEERTEWIGETYKSRFGWEVLEDIALAGPRLGASSGERRAHDRVKRAFREAGLEAIDEHTFEIPAWERGDASIEVDGERTLKLDCIALPGSPSGEIEGEFVYLGHGLPEDFEGADVEGRVVVVRSDVPDWYDHWMHRREKYGLSKEHGAAGFVYANHVEGCLPPTGSLGGGLDVIGSIPAVGISAEAGARLRRLAERGEPEGVLRVDANIEDGRSQNVTGVVGPEEGPEVLVGAHVDGHDISQAAIDNGAGVAVLCEVARALGELVEELETRVRFVGFGCEELGLVGSQHYAADCDGSSIKVVVNLDGIGEGRDLKVSNNRYPGVRPCVEQLADEFDHPVECVREYIVHSDHWPFVRMGVPGVMVHAESGNPGRGFAHTYADTLEKVDIRALRDHAILATRLVILFADRDVEIPHRTSEGVREELEELGYRRELELAGDWPFD
jgi:Zn-dependent M28 family amino/carboxypeptidase